MQLPAVNLRTADGTVIEICYATARMFTLLRQMLDRQQIAPCQVIPISRVSGPILRKIVEWASHHLNDDTDRNGRPIRTPEAYYRDLDFLKTCNKDGILEELTHALDALQIKRLSFVWSEHCDVFYHDA